MAMADQIWPPGLKFDTCDLEGTIAFHPTIWFSHILFPVTCTHFHNNCYKSLIIMNSQWSVLVKYKSREKR